MATVFIIKRHDTDTWNPRPPRFAAAADSEEAARQWISDETQGLHPDSTWTYTPTPDVDWWLQYGSFTIEEVPLHTTTTNS